MVRDLSAFKTPGNMFRREKLMSDLDACRRDIQRAVLIAFGRRRYEPGEPVLDLRALRRLEAELIVRLDIASAAERAAR